VKQAPVDTVAPVMIYWGDALAGTTPIFIRR
jgi:hypothetical protein